LAGKFGGYDAARRLSRQRRESEQGQRRYTHVAEVVASVISRRHSLAVQSGLLTRSKELLLCASFPSRLHLFTVSRLRPIGSSNGGKFWFD
jgi:hypothetical protein